MSEERALMIKVGFLTMNRLKELIKCLPFRCKSNLGLETVANEVMNWGKLTSFISKIDNVYLHGDNLFNCFH